mgnify:CR=1 FL=1
MRDDVGQRLIEAQIKTVYQFCRNTVFKASRFEPGRRASYFTRIGADRQFGNRICSECSHV